MPKQVYQIDPITQEFISPATAYENPMVKVDKIPFNIPRGCVEDAPPPHKNGFARVREGLLWIYVEDHRRQTMYSTADKQPKTITDLGAVPDGYTLIKPESFSIWKKTKWVDDLDAKKAAEKETNNMAVKAVLLSIDTASIRSIREWLSTQPDAPQFIKDHEKNAQTERNKLQK
jgi:hypothetical protein